MTETPHQLTVRVNLGSAATPSEPPASGYRWDRIVGAVVLLSLVAAVAVWLAGPASTPEGDSVATTIAGQRADDGGAEDAAIGTAVSVEPDDVVADDSRPAELLSETPTEVVPESALARQAQAVEPSRQVASEINEEAIAVKPAPVPVVEVGPIDAVSPTQGNPTVSIASGAEVATSPEISTVPVPSETEPVAVAANVAGSELRDPPVREISTRIVSDQVKRFLITDAVAAREPQGGASDIREDKKVKGLVKVIVYSDVAGHAGETLRYLWLRRDKVVASVPVGVGSDSWRSYTSKFLNKDMRGHWWVELQTSKGELLAVTEFEF